MLEYLGGNRDISAVLEKASGDYIHIYIKSLSLPLSLYRERYTYI